MNLFGIALYVPTNGTADQGRAETRQRRLKARAQQSERQNLIRQSILLSGPVALNGKKMQSRNGMRAEYLRLISQ